MNNIYFQVMDFSMKHNKLHARTHDDAPKNESKEKHQEKTYQLVNDEGECARVETAQFSISHIYRTSCSRRVFSYLCRHIAVSRTDTCLIRSLSRARPRETTDKR